jgi:hypothetical protein
MLHGHLVWVAVNGVRHHLLIVLFSILGSIGLLLQLLQLLLQLLLILLLQLLKVSLSTALFPEKVGIRRGGSGAQAK